MDVHVSGPVFVLILVGPFVYVGLLLWAIATAARRGRRGWVVSLYVLGPVALIAWAIRGRRE